MPLFVAFLPKAEGLFDREGGFPVEQVDKGLLFGEECAVVGVDQHVPHDLTLGGALPQHQMELVQRPLGHGGGPHIGRGQLLQDGELAAPLVDMDAAVGASGPSRLVSRRYSNSITGSILRPRRAQ